MNAPKNHGVAASSAIPLAEESRPADRSLASIYGAKIGPRHRDRLAIVYIRQSTPQQVLEHRESLGRQYGLADFVVGLGWPRDRVCIIDEDQGRSGTSAAQRPGFQRLLAEVSMNHVGLIIGLETSRLSRSNADWAHLLEVCAVFDTLLGDEQGVYDLRDGHDRMVLGLKGTISEFELTMMHDRLERGRQYKAARGELFQKVPTGYVKVGTGQVALDPDEQVRAVVQLIFDKYDELGSARAVLRYLVAQKIQVGIRQQEGPRRGQVEWRRPLGITLYQMLHHPMYAGAYVYGRRRRQRKQQGGGDRATEVKQLPRSEWQVLLRDRVPAYITWERYLANQERLRQHRLGGENPGPVRSGPALLPGVLVCGRCGARMHVYYPRHGRGYYQCGRHIYDPSHPRCPGLSAAAIDACVTEQVLRALEPAALELSLQALQGLEAERARLERHWQQRLKQARYEVERAERQYQAVEPENRLVARTLEERWEEALRQERQVQEDYDRFARAQPLHVSVAERQRVEALARDIPALWQADQTPVAERKAIIRCLVEQVRVTMPEQRREVEVAIVWKGGRVTQHGCYRPARCYADLPNRAELFARVVFWRQQGCTAQQIAQRLNHEGFRPPNRAPTFNKGMAEDLLHHCGLGDERRHIQLAQHEWWCHDLARHLGSDYRILNTWIQRGWVHARRSPAQKLWIVWANAGELQRLRRLVAATRGSRRPPPTLTIPRKRPKK